MASQESDRPWSFRAWVVVAVLFLTLASLIFVQTRIAILQIQRETREEVLTYSATKARLAAELVTKRLQQVEGWLLWHARQEDFVTAARVFTESKPPARQNEAPGPARPSASAMAGNLEDFLLHLVEAGGGVDHAVFFTPDGRLRAIYPPDPNIVGQDYSYRDYYRGISKAWQPYVSEAFRISSPPFGIETAVAVPVRNPDGALLGFLLGTIPLKEFDEVFAAVPSERESSLYLIDQSGRVVTSPDPALTMASYPDVSSLREAQAGRAGSTEEYSPETGKHYLTGYAPVGETGWAVLSVLDRESALVPAATVYEGMKVTNFWLLVLAGLYSGLGGLLFNRQERLVRENRQKSQELARTNVDLQKVNQELAQASRMKSEFLAGMSHELRTPLNAIIGFSELLHDDVFGPLTVTQREHVEDILSGGRHLLNLINDVLDLSKIEAGRVDLVREWVILRDLVGHIQGVSEALARKKGVTVQADLAEAPEALYGDVVRLKQILYNLVSNGIKFNRTGGTVRIRAYNLDKSDLWSQRLQYGFNQDVIRKGSTELYTVVSVQDTGIGIRPEDMKLLFQEFTQVHGPSQAQEGTGLGLALSRKLAELHGGTIWAESTFGVGSRFSFALPVPGQDGEASHEKDEQGMARAMADNLPGPDNGRVLVVVVDDDPKAAQLFQASLQPEGYRVVTVSDGQEALGLIARLKPRAIILDILMPGLDGWAVLKSLKSSAVTSSIPVLITSVLDDQKTGYQLGAADYLVKPVDRQRLLATVKRLCWEK